MASLNEGDQEEDPEIIDRRINFSIQPSVHLIEGNILTPSTTLYPVEHATVFNWTDSDPATEKSTCHNSKVLT